MMEVLDLTFVSVRRDMWLIKLQVMGIHATNIPYYLGFGRGQRRQPIPKLLYTIQKG